MMEAGVDTELSSLPRIPKRLRHRLFQFKPPPSFQQIQSKLRHADLRRQQHYEKLSSKARPKPKSPSHSSSHEEDLGQRLEAKLQAAEQKRLSLLANAQKRLSMLDELRQVAKTVVETRKEKDREKLVTKVASRAQQAEANRMLILKAYRQRRATVMERSSLSLVRKMARENKYKECVRAAISQKRAAAEVKRLDLLEAEIRRARARVLQARWVAKSVSQQREIERSRMRDKLEDRMQRAKKQRAEYLRQRGRPNISSRVSRMMHKRADILSRKLARCWRRFLRLGRTTFALTEAFNSLKINEKSVKSIPFEQLAVLIESSTTLQTVKALLDRLENRWKVARVIGATNYPSSFDNIDHLLKRVASPKRRSTPSSSARSRDARKAGFVREAVAARDTAKPSRYPVRVVLCAYMILGHPDAVLSGQGEREMALAKTAKEFVSEFELLVKIILEGPIQSSDDESESSSRKQWTFRSQLAAFDKAWCSYLNCFVAWKVKDAQALEEDLVRAACHLELSMLQTCKLTPGGDNALTHDMKAIQMQVNDDQKLLREKVQNLSGDAGIERMESALSETRSKYFQSIENGNPLSSPVTQFRSSMIPNSDSPSVSRSDIRNNKEKYIERPTHVVRSLFKEDLLVAKPNDLSASRSISDGKKGSVKELAMENEYVVNEFLHEQHHPFSDSFGVTVDEDSIEVKIRETMQKAFWDGITESLKQEEPNYDRVVQLMREIQDELCTMAPESWKQQIIEAIDVDILSQVLKSGNMDIDYLGRILEFTLVTVLKLSSPSKENKLKASYESLFGELTEICHTEDKSNNPCVIALIKGLQFVLEQIQVLKQEISKARIGIMKPILRGPHGYDYLRNAFTNRYGAPSNAYTSLPITIRWLTSVWDCKNQELEEHMNTLSSACAVSKSSLQGYLPSTSLRTGGINISKMIGSQQTTAKVSTGNEQPECIGGELDVAVRLGLLKLVTCVSGVTQEILPETFSLNLRRMRAVQSQVQKIIVITTSILVCRQIVLSEGSRTASDLETVVSKCGQQLSDMLDRNEDAGIEEITEVIIKCSGDGIEVVDAEKLQSRRVAFGRMVAKCLQAGDAVFEKVSHAVYLAARGIVLGGSGPNGRKLVEIALRQVGAATLTERMVKAAEVLVRTANVSVIVHEPWYAHLVNVITSEI